MCCNVDTIYTKTEKARLKKSHITIKGYKVLNRSGDALVVSNHKYKPGLHKMNPPVRQYNEKKPRGFHFFPNRKQAEDECGTSGFRCIVEVEVPVKDIICLSHPNSYEHQGVTNSLFIGEQAWLDAGLTLPAKRRR